MVVVAGGRLNMIGGGGVEDGGRCCVDGGGCCVDGDSERLDLIRVEVVVVWRMIKSNC